MHIFKTNVSKEIHESQSYLNIAPNNGHQQANQ